MLPNDLPGLVAVNVLAEEGAVVLTPTPNALHGQEQPRAFYDEARAAIDRAGVNKVILDLHRCTWISSAGISALLQVYRPLRQIGGTLVLCGGGPSIHEVLRLTSLDGVLTMKPDLESARRYLKEQG
jgi:anti-anti-sigma factor